MRPHDIVKKLPPVAHLSRELCFFVLVFVVVYLLLFWGYFAVLLFFCTGSFSLSQATTTSNADFRIAVPGLFACLFVFRMQIDFII